MSDQCESDPCEDETCQSCCPHDETDHGECLGCGVDRMNYLIGKAEEYY